MHKVTIPQSVIDDVVRSRGREHVFDTLDPAKTALIVIDLQNGFMMKGVAHALCEEAIEIVPNVNRLAQAVRRTGGTVVWIQNAATPESMQSWSVRDDMDGPERTARRVAAMAPGTKGYELWAGLDVKPDDLKIQKTRFSAFIQGASNLEAVLRARGIDTVIITGTVTNVCCEFDRARRHDAQLQDHHGDRRQRGGERCAPQRVADRVLSEIRRHHADRHGDRVADRERVARLRRGISATLATFAALRRGAADGRSRACLGPGCDSSSTQP